MDRTSASFRRVAWLALVAVLLSVAMPTASRFAAAASSGTTRVLMEMCTTAGRQVLDVSAYFGVEEPTPPATAGMDACGYCVLATPLPLVLLLLSLLALVPNGPAVVPSYLVRLRSPRNARGLGSQAPPLVL